jgi:hypothetical protein
LAPCADLETLGFQAEWPIMDELYPLFAVMIVTVIVMFGLVGFFKRWMEQREKLLSSSAGLASSSSSPKRRLAA